MERKGRLSRRDAWLRAAKAQELREVGWQVEKIAQTLGCGEATVWRDFGEGNIPPGIVKIAEAWAKELLSQKIRAIAAEDKGLGIIEFCERPDMLNFVPLHMQRLILKALYSLPLTTEEKEELEELVAAGKSTWKEGEKYRELVIVAGMKGGKTTLVSLIACYEAYLLLCLRDKKDPWEKWGFPKGTEVYIVNVATSADQAEDTIYAQTSARIENSPFFGKIGYKSSGKTISFEGTGIKIRCGHSNSASIVGKVCIMVGLDELARMKDNKGKSSSDEVYRALIRSIEPFGQDGKIVSISSPMWEKDKIMRLYRQSAKIPNMLGFKLATWEMNPRISREQLEYEFQKDPDGSLRDYAANPSRPKQGYYRMPSRIEEAFERGKPATEKPAISSEGILRADFKPIPDTDYYLHGDPAVRNDAFGLALGHRPGEKACLDLVYAFEAGENEIDVEEIKNVILELIRRGFGIKKATFDTWAVPSVKQALEAKSVDVENLYVLKEQHDILKNAIYDRNLEGVFPEKLRDELKQLVLLKGQKVDHPYGGSKDMADAAAAVIWHCMGEEVGVGPANASKDPTPEDDGMGGGLGGLRRKLGVQHRMIRGLTGRRPFSWE